MSWQRDMMPEIKRERDKLWEISKGYIKSARDYSEYFASLGCPKLAEDFNKGAEALEEAYQKKNDELEKKASGSLIRAFKDAARLSKRINRSVVTLIGKVNSGKSSICNCLFKQQLAEVSPRPG